MGWLGSNSSALRCALQIHLLSPAPKFYQLAAGALSSLNEPIARSFTSNFECGVGQSRSQESQELDWSAAPAIAGNFFHGREFDASPKSVVVSGRIVSEFNSAGASCSRVLAGVRVRVLGQVVRGFSSTIVQRAETKCWSCEEPFTATPSFVCSSCKAIQPLNQEMDFFQLLSV